MTHAARAASIRRDAFALANTLARIARIARVAEPTDTTWKDAEKQCQALLWRIESARAANNETSSPSTPNA